MGNYFTRNMEDTFKKNQERQIQLQCQLQQRAAAMQIARTRDLCLWLTIFYVTATVGCLAGFRKTKKPAVIAPLVPLTFVTLYFWDAAYGTKLHRIRMEAEHIMCQEADSLVLPCGLPSAASIELALIQQHEKNNTNA